MDFTFDCCIFYFFNFCSFILNKELLDFFEYFSGLIQSNSFILNFSYCFILGNNNCFVLHNCKSFIVYFGERWFNEFNSLILDNNCLLNLLWDNSSFFLNDCFSNELSGCWCNNLSLLFNNLGNCSSLSLSNNWFTSLHFNSLFFWSWNSFNHWLCIWWSSSVDDFCLDDSFNCCFFGLRSWI